MLLILALLALILAGAFPVRAGVPLFSTIVTNGPVTNRINLVLFSEGYTNGAGSNQLVQFLMDATNAARDFLGVEPYAEYSNYFNIFAIATNSAHARSTHLISVTNPVGYTYFNSSYDKVSDYYITIPPNGQDANNADGQGKITALLQQFLPGTNNDLPALLINDPVDGGSDNFGSTAITSTGFMSYILVHESGHTLGNLGDEYFTTYPGFVSVERANATTNTNYLTIKWSAWIPTNTPIPTPGYFSYLNTVGAYQGAEYHTNGWYRPFFNCCMQGFGAYGFCPVCQEALVLAIYGKVRPVDSWSPPTNNLTNITTQTLTFSLNPLQPGTHPLTVQWLTNQVVVPNATNPVLAILAGQLGVGSRKVEADVWDATPFVRTDASHVLRQTNVWNVRVNGP